MRVKDFGCLVVENSRSRAYLQKLLGGSFRPEKVILVDLIKGGKSRGRDGSRKKGDETPAAVIMRAFRERKYFMYSKGPGSILPAANRIAIQYASFDASKPVLETVKENMLPYKVVEAGSLNDPAVVEAVRRSGLKYFLFSGGGLLRQDILSLEQRFIHIHPGWVPDVKGSMAIEWSILLTGRCAASAFFMVEGIDEGEIIGRRYFDPPPLEFNNIPPLFSSHIRSELLLDIIKEYVRTGDFRSRPQEQGVGHTYYKMHPALNNVVFFKLSEKAVGLGQEKGREDPSRL